MEDVEYIDVDTLRPPSDYGGSNLRQMLTGRYSCKAYADGTRESPSVFCWIWLFVMLIGFGTGVIVDAQKISNPTDEDKKNKGKLYVTITLSTLVGLLSLYIFYKSCAFCVAWRGFFVVLAIGVLWNFIRVGILGVNKW
jgi:hypothetical protein